MIPPFGLAPLGFLDVSPLELITVAAEAGFASVNLRTRPAVPGSNTVLKVEWRAERRIAQPRRRRGGGQLGSPAHRAAGDQPSVQRPEVRGRKTSGGVGAQAERRGHALRERPGGGHRRRGPRAHLPFVLQRAPSGRSYPGMGLGLPIARQIVSAHGGGDPGQQRAGGRFHLHRHPAHRGPRARAALGHSSSESSAATNQRPRDGTGRSCSKP